MVGSCSVRGDVDVVVVGGGIGGLAGALALGRLGWRVRVLERSAEFTEVGAGLQLAPNATRILGDWGVLDRVTAAGFTPRRAALADAMDGEELTHLDLADVTERYGAPHLLVYALGSGTDTRGGCWVPAVGLTPPKPRRRCASGCSTGRARWPWSAVG